ncbi:MAG TPA: glycerophosphodiester phosphodiesterase [Bacillota bacterium]|nr:glycerophosphodiester phosphodiesterase [Bacillota bacterium]HOA34860.1 glycerophosphodiester phosphodiesterase [Bacillota bacterium]HOL14570.1 glycerophosphodiester phosphodiesterase [Bacillota bacterium]HPZ10800.1 glycerophosphodiester phosphodiesterase [Bacillota bacterium]HQE08967.1 glycerophosphodiester phosphodiesterase [Bacillota bacterium]
MKIIRFIGKAILWLFTAVICLIVLAVAVIAIRYWTWTPDPVASFYGERSVLNMGHRGAPEAAPENTISSFLAAEALGAHGIELDVMLSRDGKLAVIHDYDLDATTSGKGPVKDYTMAELKKLDAGSWFDEAFAGERIPTLEEVIEILDPQTLLNIELKTESPATDGLENAVVEVIREYDLYDRVLVSSFNPIALLRVKWADKKIPVGLLYAPDLPRYLSEGWFISILRPEALHPEIRMVDEKYMEWARKKGFRVNVWTVNEAADLKRMLDLGVDGIITDRPDLLRELMLERGMAN